MARQQRSNYTRQKLQPGAPQKVAGLRWWPISLAAAQLVIEIEGVGTDIVLDGAPQITNDDTGQAPTSAGWVVPPAPGANAQLALNYPAGFPDVTSFSLLVPATQLRNTYGSGLAPSKQFWPNRFAPHPRVQAINFAVAGSQLSFDFDSAASAAAVLAPTSIVNDTTAEQATLISVVGLHVVVDFPVLGLTPGDQVQQHGVDGGAPLAESLNFTNDGEWLQNFLFGVP